MRTILISLVIMFVGFSFSTAQNLWEGSRKVKGELVQYSDIEGKSKLQGTINLEVQNEYVFMTYTDKLGKKNDTFLQNGATVRFPKNLAEIYEQGFSCTFTRYYKRIPSSASDFCCGAFIPDPKCWVETGKIDNVDNENTIEVTTTLEIGFSNKGVYNGTLSGQWSCGTSEGFTFEFVGAQK